MDHESPHAAPGSQPSTLPVDLLAVHTEETASPVVVLDARGIVRHANPAARQHLGLPGKDLVASSFHATVLPADRTKVEELLGKPGGAVTTASGLELRHPAAGDGLRTCLWDFTRHRTEDGAAVYVGWARDITSIRREQERRVRREDRFRAVFDQADRYVCLLEPDGCVIEANLKSREAMHLKPADVVGMPFWATEWFAGAAGTGDRIRTAVERAATGELVRLELNLPGPGDDFHTLEISIRPIRDANGAVVMLLPEGRDVTELRLARDRETSMLRALATIGESAAILAHEIKNPITAIHYALQAVATELGEDQKAVIDDLVDRLKLLEKMMRRTLSFTRPLECHPKVCEVQELLEQVIADLQPVFARKGVEVALEIAEGCPDVTADPQLIGEVFANLVTNAVDAFEGGGEIRIRVEPDEAGYLHFHVADDGPGIPESLQASLFKPFFTTKSSGTGLGLALCRKILEEHGGSIEIGTTTLGGACFQVTLPAAG